MYLENVVYDAADPRTLGGFWEEVLGSETLTDVPEGFETRLSLPGDRYLDLCFPKVSDPKTGAARLHLDLRGDPEQTALVDRARTLGARPSDIGQGDVPWVVLADVEGNAFCVLEEREIYRDTGPIAALVLASGDPVRDGEFWQWLTGWSPVTGQAPVTLQHPSTAGPLLELCQESAPKTAPKNRIHIDLRLEAGDDPEQIAETITGRGGREVDHGWGDLPWRTFIDPSGNDFCLLAAVAGRGL